MGGDLTVGITQSLYKRTRGAAQMAAAERKRAVEYGTRKELENPLNGFKKGKDGKYSKEDVATARRLAEQKLKRGEFFGASLKSKFGGDKARRLKGYLGQGINKAGELFGKKNLIDLKGGKNDPSATARQRVRSAVGYESRFESSMAEAYKKDLERWNQRVQANKPPEPPGQGGKGGGISRVEGIDDLQSILEDTNQTATYIKKDTESLVESFKKQTKVLAEIAKHFGVQLDMQKDAIEDAKIDAEAQSIASATDTSGFATPDRGLDGEQQGGKKGLLGKLGDFFGDAIGSGLDPFNGDGLDLPNGRRGRRRGARRRLARRRLNRFGSGLRNRFRFPGGGGGPKPPGGGPLGKLKNFGSGLLNRGKNFGAGLLNRGRGLVGGLKKGAINIGAQALGRGKSLLGAAKGGIGRAASATKGWWDNAGVSIAKRFAFAGAKNAGKYAPGALSTGFYAADTADRLKRGDKFGAWLNAIGMGSDLAATGFAAASAGPQAVGTGPAAGIASIVSAIADSINFGRDVIAGPGSQNELGGVVDGPDSGYPVKLHGTEAIIPLDNKFTRGENPVTRGGQYERGNLITSTMGLAQSKFEERQRAESLSKSFAKGFEKYQEKAPFGGIFGAMFGSNGNPGFIQRLMGLKEIGDPNTDPNNDPNNPPPGPGDGDNPGAPSVAKDEEELLLRLIIAEAGGQGKLGMAGVARSVLNRAGLVQSGRLGAGQFNANSGSVNDIIKASGQYQPYAQGKLNRGISAAQRAKALEALNLARDPEAMRQQLAASGMNESQVKKLMAATGFRAGYAFNDPSQNVNVTKLGDHYFNTAGNTGLAVPGAKVEKKPEGTDKPAPAPSSPPPKPQQNPVVGALSNAASAAGRLLGLSQEDKNNKAKPTTVTLNNGQSTVNNSGAGSGNKGGSSIKPTANPLDIFGNITGNILSGGKK